MRPSRALVFALAVGAVAAAVLGAGVVPVKADGDRARDLLFARDCVELGRCALRTAPTTVAGIWQGGLWTGLVALGRWLSLPLRAQQAALVVAEALAVALVAGRLARLAGLGAAAVGALVATALLVPLDSASQFWNPSPLALPCSLATVALSLLATTGRARFAAVAGLGVGLAASTHPVGLLLAPALALTPVVAGRRRALAGLLAAAAAALPLALTAAPAVGVALRERGLVGARGVALAGVTFALLALAATQRGRFAAARVSSRALMPALLTLGMTAAALAGLVLFAGHPLATYYAAPAIPALALALGLALGPALETIVRRAPRGSAVVLVILVAMTLPIAWRAVGRARGFDPRWQLDDAPIVAARVLAGATRWDDVRLALEGPHCKGAAMMLSVAAPAPADEPRAAGPTRAFVLLRVPGSDAERARAAGLTTFPLADGAVGALRPVESVLDRDAAEACFQGGIGPEGCVPVLPAASEHVGAARFLFERRAYPEAYAHRHGGSFELAFVVPLRPRLAAVRIDLVDRASERCPWSLARVEDAATEGALPARSATLSPGPGGRLVLARRIEAGRCDEERDDHLPPCVLESAPEDDALRALAELAR